MNQKVDKGVVKYEMYYKQIYMHIYIYNIAIPADIYLGFVSVSVEIFQALKLAPPPCAIELMISSQYLPVQPF